MYIDILEDDDLKDIVNRFLSGLIPQSEFDPSFYSTNLSALTGIIKSDEFSGEYYVLVRLLEELNKVGMNVEGYSPKLSREVLDLRLKANILNLVRNEDVRIEGILEEEGYQTNIKIDTVLETACQLLYRRTMELYDDSFDLEIPSNEVLTYVPVLKDVFVTHVAEQSLRVQSEILNDGIKVNRKLLRGYQDWIDYTTGVAIDINSRINQSDNGIISIEDVSTAYKMLEEAAEAFEPIGTYGIPPIDDGTPILKHRLVVVAANENVGKTKIAINTAVRLVREGKKIVYMCGEAKRQLTYCQLLSNYIYQEFNIHLTPMMVAKKHLLPPDKARYVDLAILRTTEQGSLHMAKSFGYDTLYTELADLYNSTKFDAIFIDHTYALVGKGNEYENISRLAVALREFKNDFPPYIMVLSHLSTIAKDALIKGKAVEASPTKGSSTLSAEADEIFVLVTDEILARSNLLGLQVYKRRDADKITDLLILEKNFAVSSFIWDERKQNAVEGTSVSAEAAIQSIQREMVENDEEEYLDET